MVWAILRVTCGNFLEQYDFFLFGFYAAPISRTFFPASSEFASLMLTFGVFGAGFLMRPLGALVLGAYIDTHGRRKGLILTLSLMALGTALIATLPGYAVLGLWAPVLVVCGRLLQGFSAGAEMGGVSIYLAEIAPPGQRGFYTAWQSASQQVSIMLAAALGYGLECWLPPGALLDWGWRLPFALGCLIIPWVLWLRRHLPESPAFQAHRPRPGAVPGLPILRRHWRVLVGGMLMGALTTATFNLITVYTPTFGRTMLHLSLADSLLVTLCVAISNFIWLPLAGALSDRIGRLPLLIGVSSAALLTAYPALMWLVAEPGFGRLLAVLLLFSAYYGGFNGALVVALAELMPAEIRVLGFSLAFSLATALFGGVTLAVSTYLIDLSGDRAAPGLWMSFAAVCSLGAACLLYSDEARRQST